MNHVMIALQLIAVLLAILSLAGCLFIWIWRRKFFREEFSLAIMVFVSWWLVWSMWFAIAAMMPWTLAASAVSGLSPSAGFADYALLFLLSFLILDISRRMHKSWSGMKSRDQYRREQRNEELGLQGEAFLELRRLFRGQSRPEPYLGNYERSMVSQLQLSVEVVSWRDRARDLVKLSSSAYIFDRDSGWRETESCWVGKNVETGGLVLLYPTHEAPTEGKLASLSRLAARLANDDGDRQKREELLVALSGRTRPSENADYEMVRYVNEGSLLDSLLDLSDYKNEIRRRVTILRLPETNLSILDTYVAGSLEDEKGEVEAYIQKWLDDPGQRQLALLGEYGRGKSTTALMFTYRTLCSGELPIKRVPLLIELRGTSPRNLDPLGLLGAWAAKYNMNAQALMQLHLAGRLLLIFEGFDEMALVGDAEMRLRHFKTLWDFCSPGAKIMITGRPNFFLDEEEMKAALGIAKPVGNRPYCEAVRLSPFTVPQINLALRSQSEAVRGRVCRLAEENPRFLELVSRPSLLHIVSVLWEKENLSARAELLTSAYLMDLFVRFSYRRQGLKEYDSLDFSALTTAERSYFMSGIATYMASRDLPNQISGRQLSECVELLLGAIPDAVSLEADAISGESRRPLRSRIKGAEFGLEHVKTDVRACGLLVDDPATPGTFRFGHKSFLEYLFAEVVSEKIRESKREAPYALLKAVGGGVEDVLHWPVALEFVAELLGEQENQISSDGGDPDYVRAIILFSVIFPSRTRLSLLFRRVQGFLALLLGGGWGILWSTIFTSVGFGTALFCLWAAIKGKSHLLEGGVKLKTYEPEFVRLIVTSAFAALAGACLQMYLRYLGVVRSRVMLWEALCRALKIDESVLEKVIWAPLIRKMRFRRARKGDEVQVSHPPVSPR